VDIVMANERYRVVDELLPLKSYNWERKPVPQEGLRKTSPIGFRGLPLDGGLGQSGKNKPYTGSDSLPASTGTTEKPRKTIRFCSC
jgi:hypothetical protein